MASSGKTRFSDTKFPKPHNITELALDEMWGIYGTDVPLSVVVNIGPGLPNDVDVQQIARRFSWGSKINVGPTAVSEVRVNLAAIKEKDQSKRKSFSVPQSKDVEPDAKGLLVNFHGATIRGDSISDPVADGERRHLMSRTNTFGSIKDRGIDSKLRRLEDDIESDIKKKLKNIYPSGPLLYYRLAPTKAPQGAPQNDSSASGVVFDATISYLNKPHVETTIDEVARRMPEVASMA
jgi:hypothetical protein